MLWLRDYFRCRVDVPPLLTITPLAEHYCVDGYASVNSQCGGMLYRTNSIALTRAMTRRRCETELRQGSRKWFPEPLPRFILLGLQIHLGHTGFGIHRGRDVRLDD